MDFQRPNRQILVETIVGKWDVQQTIHGRVKLETNNEKKDGKVYPSLPQS